MMTDGEGCRGGIPPYPGMPRGGYPGGGWSGRRPDGRRPCGVIAEERGENAGEQRETQGGA